MVSSQSIQRRALLQSAVALPLAAFLPACSSAQSAASSISSTVKSAVTGGATNMLSETFTMNDGRRIPKIGLGVWGIDNDKSAETVRQAVAAGYRHIDTAQAYRNEAGVGEGVRTCGVAREQIFVTTKVAAEAKSYEAAASSIDESLKRAGLQYFDLMIIHSPQPWAEWRSEKKYYDENRAVWRALEDAQAAGKLRSIGVSNFLRPDLENIFKEAKVRPAVNQVLAHIGNTPFELAEFCSKENILVQAYSPLAHGEVLKNPDIAAMAAKYKATPAQLCIRYVLQLGMVALPKTMRPERMKENAAVDFTISDADMQTLRALRAADYGEFTHFPVFSGK